MANKKIQGITIQFGADTSPLNKAIKESEKTSTSLNRELGQVNKLLKFDPGNTDILSQKQKILAESIENTEMKLEALRQAQSEVEKMFQSGDIGEKEYREFQRSVAETEQSLKSYTTQMSKMQSEQDNVKSSTKQLNTLLDATGKDLNDFQDILGTKLTNSLRNGTANSDDLTVAINKIGKASLGADADLSEMRNALNKINDSGIDGVRKSLDNLKGDSGETEDALKDIGKGVTAGNLMKAGEIISGIGDKVIDLGKNAQETALQFQDSNSKMKAALGLTDQQAEETANVIKTVFESGVTDSVDEATEAVKITKQAFKDLNDTDLAEITRQIKSIADTTGTDVQENTNAAKKLMQNFGLSANDSLDLIAAGFQNGLNQQNDFLDTLNEYSPYFEQMGYSASDFISILNNGMDAGAYNTDKVADAVKEFQIRLGDGSFETNMGSFSKSTQGLFAKWKDGKATVKEVFQSVGNDLKGMSTEKQQQALSTLSSQFEDLGTNASLSLFDIGDKFNDVSGKAADMAEQKPGEKMQGDLNKVSEALIPIGNDIQKALSPVLEFIAKISEEFAKLPEPVRNFIEAFGGITAIAAVLSPVIALFVAFGGVLIPIIGIVVGVAAAIAAIIAIIKNWGAITDWLSEKWESFKDWIAGLWNSISGYASEVWDGIKDYFAGLWDSISGKAAEIWNGISETIQSVWNGIVDFLKTIWEAIYSIIEVPLNLILSIIDGVMYAIYAIIYTVWEVIKFAIKSAWDWISQMAISIFTPVAEFFSAIWNGISDAAIYVWEIIKGALSGAWNWIKDMAFAIFNPIAEFFSGIWNGIKETAVGVWTAIKDAIGGIWDGIKDKATGVFSMLWGYIKDGFNSLKDTLGGIVKGIANGIIAPIGGAVNGVIRGVNWILGKIGSGKHFDLWDVPKFAQGTGGIKKDTVGIVNDQKGSTYKELIVPPDGSPFIAEGRDVMLPLQKGTKIMPANRTKSFLETLPHFAGGIGSFFGGIWESVKSFTGNVWDYISHPSKIVQIAIDKFADLSGAAEPWLSLATGIVSNTFDGIVDFIKGIFDKEEKPEGYQTGIGDVDLSNLLPRLPTLDVRWFKEGGILTKPTLFNMDNGRIGGAGEEGPEAIAPLSKLKELFQEAVIEIFGDKDVNINLNLSMVTDGREWAKATVPYTQPLLTKREKLQNKLRGN